MEDLGKLIVPKDLKSCPKSNKLSDLVTLIPMYLIGRCRNRQLLPIISFQLNHCGVASANTFLQKIFYFQFFNFYIIFDHNFVCEERACCSLSAVTLKKLNFYFRKACRKSIFYYKEAENSLLFQIFLLALARVTLILGCISWHDFSRFSNFYSS